MHGAPVAAPPRRPGQRRRLPVLLLRVLLGLLVGGMGGAPALAQRIILDSTLDPELTQDPEINRSLRVKIGFGVTILNPDWLTPRGKKVKYGFGKWYIHVVRSRSVWIKGRPTNTRDHTLLLAVATRQKRMPEEPDTLHSRALFIKGLIDRTDSLPHYRRLTDSLIQQADSLDSWVTDPDNPNDPTNKLLKSTLESLFPLQDKLNVYSKLERVKGKPRKLIKLFFGPVFRTNLKYHVQSMPHGLPKYVPPEPEPEPEPEKRPRKLRKKPYDPGKYKQRKFDRKKTNWGRKRFKAKKLKYKGVKRKPLDLKDLGLF